MQSLRLNMEEDEKPYPTMLFVNEAFLHAKELKSSKTKAEIKRDDDQRRDLCSQNTTCVKREECVFDERLSSHLNQDVVLLKVEKKKEKHTLAYDSTWIKSESEILVGIGRDDDNIEMKVERNEEDSILFYDPIQIKMEREIQINPGSLISNDYCHTKVENDESDGFCLPVKSEIEIQVDTDSLTSRDYYHARVENDGGDGFCLPMKSEIGQNQAASPDCCEIKLERDDEDDISFNDTCPTTNTDSSLVTSPDIPTNIQEYSKAGTVPLASRIDGTMEEVENHSEIRMMSVSTLDHDNRISSKGKDYFNHTMTMTQPVDETGKIYFYSCPVCVKYFTNRSQLKQHMRHHTVEKPYQGNDCDKAFNHSCSITKHMKRHGEKSFKCIVCDKTFSKNRTLTTHMRLHTGERLFNCTDCDKAFTRNSDLTAHMRLHMGERPFKCTACGRAFTRNNDLTTHMRLHTGETPYKCTLCDKAFTHRYSFTTHMRFHSGEKPFKCTVCGKAFVHSFNLTTHMRLHTGEKPFKCTVCDKAFSHSSNLTRHMRLHTREQT